jgi:hypothetical protein
MLWRLSHPHHIFDCCLSPNSTPSPPEDKADYSRRQSWRWLSLAGGLYSLQVKRVVVGFFSFFNYFPGFLPPFPPACRRKLLPIPYSVEFLHSFRKLLSRLPRIRLNHVTFTHSPSIQCLSPLHLSTGADPYCCRVTQRLSTVPGFWHILMYFLM